MRLEISQVFGQVDIKQIPAQLRIKNLSAAMEVKQVPARVFIEAEPVKVDIDFTRVFADMGLRGPGDFLAYHAREGWRKSMEGIARQAQTGDRAAAVEGGEDVFVELGKEAIDIVPQVNIGVTPKSRPEVTFSGSLNIEATKAHVDIEVRPNPPQITFLPGKVEVYLEPRPQLDIQLVGSVLDIIV